LDHLLIKTVRIDIQKQQIAGPLVSQVNKKGLPCGNHLLEQFVNQVSHIRRAMWHPILGQ
jgi:hypothetical protein